ncbi:MAE_28990/MAE_18760 family HEPN-like nuclease [Alkalibacillus haloalkaliphilus]|uniref:RiboL-PSP-HEPN domain-containing protein n=1 Tax=Alkalibacillus haloalkaliphilus TaxID=94136 RepID=A0A511W2T6_9BACI|nr:MAE_28990/MAE_18760 family HEPN-like nuclease [Alkalibacillus haloalkaliphilus]GEN45399.1 hypothetical protein AHA02nite_11750 [Alkalibacillus haloalkaliphilus]
MEYSIIEFNHGTDKLNKYITGIKNNRELFAKIKRISGHISSDEYEIFEDIKQQLKFNFDKDIRIYEYTSIIINLYGLFERYIENSIIEYIDFLKKSIPKYSSLPVEIINNHYELSAQLISSLNLPKYKDIITKETIISNLYSCANCKGDKKYRLNSEAFTQHSYNFRGKSLNEFFKTVGISNLTSLLKQSNGTFRKYLDEIEIPVENCFDILDDLAERRNRISHGAEEDDILGIDELSRYMDYINNLVKSINDLLNVQLIPYLIEKGDNLIEVGTPFKQITDKIVGIKLSNINLNKGDKIFIDKGQSDYSYAVIQSMQINNESYDNLEINGEGGIDVGIGFDCKVTPGYTLYMITTN